ncbi:MAG: hybrid sensor histidine kinase/response regulator [Planctomycetes bacterium]|nr:hybrid sensor histidine kinase/response regulator [Planctomycetota bacterium]
MSDDGGFAGVSLLELFKLEAESHCEALTQGLLALEKSPGDTSAVEPLMRAAHSIKGAARIVGLDVIVTLAHVMEECFLAAKSGKEMLSAGRVDQLLRGVDVLAEIRAISEAELSPWTASQAARIDGLVAELKAPVGAGAPEKSAAAGEAAPMPSVPAAGAAEAVVIAAEAKPIETPVAIQPAVVPSPVLESRSAAPAKEAAETAAASVRVASDVLNRMLSLAGESTVEASRMQALRALSENLRARERALENGVESLREKVHESRRQVGKHIERQTGTDPHASKKGDDQIDEWLASLGAETGRLRGAVLEHSTRFEETVRRVEELSGALYTEVLRSRMRPFSEGASAFPRMVRDIARQLNKSVEFQMQGGGVEVDREILQKLESPLTHMIRNSLDHGVEPEADRIAKGKTPKATIKLTARHQSGMLVVEVQDDGAGIDPEAIRRKVVERRMVDEATAARLTRPELMEFPFLPGFSTKQAVTEISGRGVGLDVVMSMVQGVSGTITLESEPGKGTRFVMRLPVTRSVLRAALVRIGGQLFAVPLARLHRVALVAREDVRPVQGRQQFTLDEQSVGLLRASDMLGGDEPAASGALLSVLVIGGRNDELCGLIVDEVCGEEDLVIRPLDPRLGTVAHISAAAIRADGIPVFVVDVDDLLRSVKQLLQEGRPLGVAARIAEAQQSMRRRILVVDDSITVREVERQLLQRRGYHVEIAVDGKEGLNALKAGKFDLLVTDVDMPRMTGIELIRALRKEARFADLPVIIVSYKDREEDRLAGLDAGANAYLTKSSFHDDSLIRMVEDLIGAPT